MHPYKTLDDRSFWATAVAQKSMFDIENLWDPRFSIDQTSKVATYGSCFAQHIGRALKSRGFHWMVTEAGPEGVSSEILRAYNYGVFTARTANIYTVSLLRQWVDWALGKAVPDDTWEKDGRFYDPFRPRIEPSGFASKEEMLASRRTAINCFRESLTSSDVFVFTLGLTESWFNRDLGYEYPMCPGTVAGEFNPQVHQFVNQDFLFIRKSLIKAIKGIRSVNPDVKVLLTVSPVPLTATMSGNHVLVATTESKSILRAIAGDIRQQFDFVDYFPSYEIITSAPFRAVYFEPNQREVNHTGVTHVMSVFFKCLSGKFGPYKPTPPSARLPPRKVDDVICEEELLSAFAPGS
jgi:hypothetical protein